MSALEIGWLALALMVLLVWAGMHVAIVLTLLSAGGVWLIRGDLALTGRFVAQAAYDSIANHLFAVVPLFVLMGVVVAQSDLGRDTFRFADRLFRAVRGGLGIATVAANAVFAAVTGISIASAAVFTKVAVPEMRRAGYTARFAVGVVAGSSVLGMLIPPSLLLIVYGFLTEASIGALFIAGVIPGLVLALAYAVAIYLMARWWPAFVGRPHALATEKIGLVRGLAEIGPIALLILLVLGGLYSGAFTATESGAVGALGALLLALAKRRLDWKKLWRVLVETGHITVSVCFLLIAASIYSRMLALSGLTQWVAGGFEAMAVGKWAFLAAFIALVLLMGMVLDSTSILLIVIPLVLPLVKQYGFDLVWFGIVTVIAVEVGLLTPPFGLSVFVIKSTLDDPAVSLNDIFAGALPFAGIMILVLVLIVAVPWLSLALV